MQGQSKLEDAVGRDRAGRNRARVSTIRDSEKEDRTEMAVKIRLTRTGRKKLASYRVVVADSEAPRDGRFIEIVGTYDPKAAPAKVIIDEAAVLAWLRKGAQPTETVRSLLSKVGAWKKLVQLPLLSTRYERSQIRSPRKLQSVLTRHALPIFR